MFTAAILWAQSYWTSLYLPTHLSTDIVLPYLNYYWYQLALFVVLLFGAVAYALHRNISWIAKSVILVFSFVLVFATLVVDYHVAGLPSILRMPQYVQIIGVDVQEPTSTDKGYISYWTKAIDPTTKIVEHMPRVFILPFTLEEEKNASKVQQHLRAGHKVTAKTSGDNTLPSGGTNNLGDEQGMKFKDDLLGERLEKDPSSQQHTIEMTPDP